MRNAVGDASQDTTSAPHTSVAHDDQISVDLIGDAQNRSRGIVRERVCEVLSRVARRDRLHRSFGVSPTGALRARIGSVERDHEVEVRVELLGYANRSTRGFPRAVGFRDTNHNSFEHAQSPGLRSALILPGPIASCEREAESDAKTAPAETGATSVRSVFGAFRQVSNPGRGSRRTESSVR